jgi:hypothetical protein
MCLGARVARERRKPEGAICSGKKVLSYEQEAILPVKCMFRIKKRE